MKHREYTDWKKQIRVALYRENSRCPICGREMVLFSPKAAGLTPVPPNNAATLDHIYSKFSDERVKQDRRVRLICRQCNQLRSEFEMAHLRVEDIWERSSSPKSPSARMDGKKRHLLWRESVCRRAAQLPGSNMLIPQ